MLNEIYMQSGAVPHVAWPRFRDLVSGEERNCLADVCKAGPFLCVYQVKASVIQVKELNDPR